MRSGISKKGMRAARSWFRSEPSQVSRMRRGGGLRLRLAKVAGDGHGEDEFGTVRELNAIAVGSDLVAAFGASRRLEAKILEADNNARTNGVRRPSGIQVFVVLIGTENGLADLANTSRNFGGHVLVKVMRLARRANKGDDPELQGLLVAVVTVGAIEVERNLGGADGDDAGVNDRICIESASWVIERAREFEPNVFAGFEVSGVETGHLGLDGGPAGDRNVRHGRARGLSSRSGRGLRWLG